MTGAHAKFWTLPDGVQLHYRIQGPAGAPWIVMFNGLLSDHTLWAGVAPKLAKHYRVLTYDMRGQGKSDAPNHPYHLAQSVSDALDLMEGLGINRPLLVGLSNGAAVVLGLLVRRPGYARGGIAVAGKARVDFAMKLRIQHWMDCLEAGGPLLQFGAVAPFLWGDRFLEKRYEVLRAYHASLMSSGQKGHQAGEDPYRGARNQMRGALEWTLEDRLEDIVDPVLLLSGAEDLLTPPWKGLEAAKRISTSRFEVIPGVGHSYPVEDPKGFLARVETFLDELEGGADRDGRTPAQTP